MINLVNRIHQMENNKLLLDSEEGLILRTTAIGDYKDPIKMQNLTKLYRKQKRVKQELEGLNCILGFVSGIRGIDILKKV